MSTPKGYTAQRKEDRLKAEFATLEGIRTEQFGLSVLAHATVREVATDAVEASSTTSVINATAHVAQRGDIIRFTSGTHSGKEVKVYAISTNSFELAETLSVAPSAADTFQILRHKFPTVAADGSTLVTPTSAGAIQFLLDGSNQTVTEDTVTPSNNRPLPVKLTGVTGDLTITAQNLNVQSTHTGANPDSMQIGNGTNVMGVNASSEALVTASQSGAWSLTNISGTISLPTGASTEATLSAINAKFGALGQALMAASAPVVIASDQSPIPVTQSGSWTTTVTATNLDIRDLSSASDSVASVQSGAWTVTATATDLDIRDLAFASDSVTAHQGGSWTATVTATNLDIRELTSVSDSVSAVQSGAWTVTATATDLDIRDLAFATDSVTAHQGGAWTATVTATNLDIRDLSSASDSVAAVQSGAWSVTTDKLDVVDFMDTPLLVASSTNIPASASLPLEVVASLAANVFKLRVSDTTGEFIGVYTGAASSEVLQAIIGPGMDGEVEVKLLSAERVSLRNMKNAVISTGDLVIQFIG